MFVVFFVCESNCGYSSDTSKNGYFLTRFQLTQDRLRTILTWLREGPWPVLVLRTNVCSQVNSYSLAFMLYGQSTKSLDISSLYDQKLHCSALFSTARVHTQKFNRSTGGRSSLCQRVEYKKQSWTMADGETDRWTDRWLIKWSVFVSLDVDESI